MPSDKKRKSSQRSGSASHAKRKEHTKSVIAAQGSKVSVNAFRGAGTQLEKSKEFSIELQFSNPLPRPILGPVFKSAVSSASTLWKSGDVESSHIWRLHTEKDLGVTIETVDPKVYAQKATPPLLEEGDEAIINWTGHEGDSVGEAARARREGNLGGAKNGTASSSQRTRQGLIKLKERKAGSRVLDEAPQFYQKRTTYLANDIHKRVHAFESLADQRKKMAKELDAKAEQAASMDAYQMIKASFDAVNSRGGISSLKHPTKPGLTAVSSLPLLPSRDTWPANYAIADISQPQQKKQRISKELLSTCLIGDVDQKSATKLLANVLVEETPGSSENIYKVWQEFDLDVLPLKEDNLDTNFVIVIDEESGVCYYHPLSSKLVLTTARLSANKDRRKVDIRDLNEEETLSWKKEKAPMDQDVLEELYPQGIYEVEN
ncbi:hypothetical protein TrST_g1757 [Triparma strigata]|uniref:Uncharacterized protein n=1 Tax=Triparma strigata TaxID=1606541 RepID=A0A9W7C0E1_9STRA|nr:hypothetical protein TrST_g1757 [Triparma strigata]